MARGRTSISNNRRKAAHTAFDAAAALHRQGRFDAALEHYEAALDADPTSDAARSGMTAILETARSPVYNARLARYLESCLDADTGNFLALSRPAAHQIRLKYGIGEGPHRIDPQAPEIRDMAHDPLILRFLEKTYNMDGVLEAFVTELRRALLTLVLEAPQRADALLPLIAAIALQAFNNEYVFWQAPGEAEQVDVLEQETRHVKAAATEGRSLFEVRLATLAMYRPPSDPDWRDAILGADLESWQAPVRAVIRRVLAEPAREGELKRQIERFGSITDATSRAVGGQYEENPYPRWLHLPAPHRIDIVESVMRDYPAARRPKSPGGPLRILSAGCGTGQHPLSLARSYRNSHVTGIDLSASSLAYAMRKAEETKVRNARFLQGDILEASRLGTMFDVIESIGVLHHMADPFAGWKALLGVLKPGGLIRIALYGRDARKAVSAARRHIAANSIPAGIDGIRDFRHRLFADPNLADLRDLTDWDDFYTTSNVRDLLFHVNEHLFTVADVRHWVDATGMRFLGWEISAGFARDRTVQRKVSETYAREHPEDTAMTDLAAWEAFEQAHPDLFEGYCFWCQKP